ncbi:CD209 antigen-like [Seriola aureovittata]|uniref:CD209 antigen-like n=1 Tax=Seriola aureovittata TaxID=2871759 RepID=UPI0024BD8C2E|nr:CD209 antigen-like [Seriola aureovittata]
MSEDIYAMPDLTKKVRFQTRENEGRNADKTDNVNIYDNYWAEGSTPPKLQDTTEEQQQINAPSGKRDLVRPAAVFLVLLCLLLLAVVIAVVVLWVQDKSLNDSLTIERDELLTNYSEMTSLNVNLTIERDELRTNYSEMTSLNINLIQKTHQLQEDIFEVTKDRDKLKKQLETSSCPAKWMKFGNTCYSFVTSRKNWSDSKQFCESRGGQLPIISSEEEQIFLSSFPNSIWLGITDEEQEGVWKLVDGTNATTFYWRRGQPDNAGQKENCAQISKWFNGLNNWNDLPCSIKLFFICEKILK